MRILALLLAASVAVSLRPEPVSTSAAEPAAFPKFKMQEIDAQLKIGYAVLTADLNGDK